MELAKEEKCEFLPFLSPHKVGNSNVLLYKCELPHKICMLSSPGVLLAIFCDYHVEGNFGEFSY